jgi:hypothetical protein
MPEIELELTVISKFIISGKSDRYLGFASKNKTREKFTSCLAHFRDLDPLKFTKTTDDPEVILYELSKKFNFENCYVISENKNIDGKRLCVDQAIKEVVGYGMGTLLVFGSADIVYYEGEEANDRWVSNTR